MPYFIHLVLNRIHASVAEFTGRAGMWLVQGVGWPLSLANMIHDLRQGGQVEMISVVGPIMLGIAALIQAALAVVKWWTGTDRPESRKP